MESRSYMFSTALKRSTMTVSKGIEFPREDADSPRQIMLRKECPVQLTAFKTCVAANPKALDKCAELKKTMQECLRAAIKLSNTDPNYVY